MNNQKKNFIIGAILLMLLTLSACGTTLSASAPDITTYNGYAEFIPFIPGGFPDDFDLDGAKIGIIEENGQDVYWEYYVGADGRYFLTLQRPMTGNELPIGETLEIQGWAARLGILEEMPDIPELTSITPVDITVLSIDGRTKLNLPVLIQIISNASPEQLVTYGELIEPSICLSSPTPQPDA